MTTETYTNTDAAILPFPPIGQQMSSISQEYTMQDLFDQWFRPESQLDIPAETLSENTAAGFFNTGLPSRGALLSTSDDAEFWQK